MADEGVVIKFKWRSTIYDIVTHPEESVDGLRRKVEAATSVQPKRQKLLGLKGKDGKAPTDATLVKDLALKANVPIMMLGAPEENIAALDAQAEVAPAVQDDFDLDPPASSLDPRDIRDEPGVRERLARRVARTEVKVLQPPRPGKKLLVLDIDYTLFDLGSSAERADQLARPFLHHFLTLAYAHYDIAIWSATSMKWIEVKMRELGVSTHEQYKLTFMLDHMAMVTVHHEKHGVFDCKPLEFVWQKFPGVYTPENTIMMDDLRRNYILNPQNGLVIRPFRKSHRSRDTDRELLFLGAYLQKIAALESLSGLDHGAWEAYAAQEIRAALRDFRDARAAALSSAPPGPEA
ncbi:hypothetical protein ACKKBG_A12610 [Auxenochlorella protothecoides x Auxenochlorella symbiontica]